MKMEVEMNSMLFSITLDMSESRWIGNFTKVIPSYSLWYQIYTKWI